MTNNESDDWTTFGFGWEGKKGEQKREGTGCKRRDRHEEGATMTLARSNWQLANLEST